MPSFTSARGAAVHAGDLQLHPGHARVGAAAGAAGEPAAAGEPLQRAEAPDQGREERGQGEVEGRRRGSRCGEIGVHAVFSHWDGV